MTKRILKEKSMANKIMSAQDGFSGVNTANKNVERGMSGISKANQSTTPKSTANSSNNQQSQSKKD